MNGFKESVFEEFIIKVIQNRDSHARFLNTLSMLEYVGARKIFKSQQAETITLSLLNHAADEIRHARLLKKASLDMSGGLLQGYDEGHLLCGQAARRYFQAVDHLPGSHSAELTSAQRYALTTWLVERRVLKIYPVYESALATNEQCTAQHAVIKTILKDEERHMDHVDQCISRAENLSQSMLDQLKQSEEECFQELACVWLDYAPMGSPPKTPKTSPVM